MSLMRIACNHARVTNAVRTTLSEMLWRRERVIARACQWRHDGAVIPGRKRDLSPVILMKNRGLSPFSLLGTPGSPDYVERQMQAAIAQQ